MTIDQLFNELLRAKPRGWSVTRAGQSLSIRPPDRTQCKFSLYYLNDGSLAVGRFDRTLNHWTGHQYIKPESLSAHSVFEQLLRRTMSDK
jgi:hypothetical protein